MLQSVGFALTIAGYLLGHSHKGRAFLPSVHGSFAKFLYLPISAQLALGVYLKMHIHEQTIRPWAVKAHGILGKSYPIIGWTQMLFGSATFFGYCRGGHLGQCLAHYIMVCPVGSDCSIYLHLTRGFNRGADSSRTVSSWQL